MKHISSVHFYLLSFRLKENAKQESEKAKRLSLDLQRKEDDTSDLREKLADYKKQIQQVQKEVRETDLLEDERGTRHVQCCMKFVCLFLS